tara:strand:- start:2452 stop:3294 length:843 start_codon:yes stop_codon:yes gene_type:complete
MNVENINELDKNKLTIACTTNQKYMHYVKPFLNSIEKHNTNLNVVLRLVNCNEFTNEYHNFDLYKIYETKTFENKSIPAYDADAVFISNTLTTQSTSIRKMGYQELLKSIKSGDSKFIKSEGKYCCNIRFNTVKMLIYNNFKHILYLDVDTIVNKNFSSIITESKDHDLAMYVGPWDANADLACGYVFPDGGLMYVNNTELSKKFYEKLTKKISRPDILATDSNEFEFKKLLSELNIKMLVLDKKYKDNGPEYNVDSYMWSGVGDHKKSDMFKQKLKEYM